MPPKVFSLNLGREFTCEVGLRPNSTYVRAALEKYLFCHSNSQFLSFAFVIFLLALLRDWTWSRSVARGTFALFLVSWLREWTRSRAVAKGQLCALLVSWSANSFPSIPEWPGIHWNVGFLPVWSQPSARSLNCLKNFRLELLGIQHTLRATPRLAEQMCMYSGGYPSHWSYQRLFQAFKHCSRFCIIYFICSTQRDSLFFIPTAHPMKYLPCSRNFYMHGSGIDENIT